MGWLLRSLHEPHFNCLYIYIYTVHSCIVYMTCLSRTFLTLCCCAFLVVHEISSRGLLGQHNAVRFVINRLGQLLARAAVLLVLPTVGSDADMHPSYSQQLCHSCQ
jgi:hypothetical protein